MWPWHRLDTKNSADNEPLSPRKTWTANNHMTQSVHGNLMPPDPLWNKERINAFSKQSKNGEHSSAETQVYMPI